MNLLRRSRVPAGLDVAVTSTSRWPLEDPYHYLMTASWPTLIVMIVGLFLATNSLFALAYLADGGVEHARPGSFADVFFFSVQTMATIGYGTMAPRSSVSNLLTVVEVLFGLIGLATVTGLVFAKFSRTNSRVRFSRYAIVSPRDGIQSLQFRVANVRANRIVEAQIHVALARQEVTVEGDRVRRFYDLSLSRNHNPLFALSWTVIHPIVEGSPLYGQTRESLRAATATIMVSLVGLDETFFHSVHARYYYRAGDIVFGGRFADIFEGTVDTGVRINLTHFDEVLEIDRPKPVPAARR